MEIVLYKSLLRFSLFTSSLMFWIFVRLDCLYIEQNYFRYKPDVIKGDMDSIRRDVLDFYVSLVSSSSDFTYIPCLSRIFIPNPSQCLFCVFVWSYFALLCFWFLLLLFVPFQGTQVIDESHDQDTTDLDKCILYIRDSASNLESSRVSSSFNKALCFFFVFSWMFWTFFFISSASSRFLPLEHSGEDLIMKLVISTSCIDIQTQG